MAGARYSIIPSDAVFDDRLTRFDLHVLTALGAHSNNNGWCTIKQATLAAKINSTPGSVHNAVGRLVAFGYVKRRFRYADNGAQLASLYQVAMDREPLDADLDAGISLDESAEPAPAIMAGGREGGALPSAGGVHSPVRGGRTPQCTLKNDPFLERPSSVEDKAHGSPRDQLMVVLDADRAEAVIEHRRRLRKPLTPYAAKLLAGKFRLCPDPNAAADAMIANGWQGFDPGWLSERKASPGPAVSGRPRNVVEAAQARLRELQDGNHAAG